VAHATRRSRGQDQELTVSGCVAARRGHLASGTRTRSISRSRSTTNSERVHGSEERASGTRTRSISRSRSKSEESNEKSVTDEPNGLKMHLSQGDASDGAAPDGAASDGVVVGGVTAGDVATADAPWDPASSSTTACCSVALFPWPLHDRSKDSRPARTPSFRSGRRSTAG
jgi:hypothetical protein